MDKKMTQETRETAGIDALSKKDLDEFTALKKQLPMEPDAVKQMAEMAALLREQNFDMRVLKQAQEAARFYKSAKIDNAILKRAGEAAKLVEKNKISLSSIEKASETPNPIKKYDLANTLNDSALDAIEKITKNLTNFDRQKATADALRSDKKIIYHYGEYPGKVTSRQRVLEDALDIGELVREKRNEDGLTQQKLANFASVSRRFIVQLEQGKTTLEIGKVLQVCTVLGIDIMAQKR